MAAEAISSWSRGPPSLTDALIMQREGLLVSAIGTLGNEISEMIREVRGLCFYVKSLNGSTSI